VVDTIHPAELVDGAGDEGSNRLLLAYVARHPYGAPTRDRDGARHVFGRLFVDVTHRHCGTLLRKEQGSGASDVGCTPAQEDDLAVQLAHGQPFTEREPFEEGASIRRERLIMAPS
jgi:hypothetical protein